MTLLARIDENGTLMYRMAETVEADFGDALLAGEVTADILRDAVLRCARCEAADFCESWLEVNEARKKATGTAPEAPDFCANRDMMNNLRP